MRQEIPGDGDGGGKMKEKFFEKLVKKGRFHVDVGMRPYIVTPTGNPYMDLYTEVSLHELQLSVPVGNCAWYQFSLIPADAMMESGRPNTLPCGHIFHYKCIVELFEKRIRAGEKEGHKCPLYSVWFRDVREIPGFYGRYRGKKHEFDSICENSELSASEVGESERTFWAAMVREISGSGE